MDCVGTYFIRFIILREEVVGSQTDTFSISNLVQVRVRALHRYHETHPLAGILSLPFVFFRSDVASPTPHSIHSIKQIVEDTDLTIARIGQTHMSETTFLE
jgi:hypothetical protein